MAMWNCGCRQAFSGMKVQDQQFQDFIAAMNLFTHDRSHWN